MIEEFLNKFYEKISLEYLTAEEISYLLGEEEISKNGRYVYLGSVLDIINLIKEDLNRKETNKRLSTNKESIVSLLNQQDQRIAELEEQVKGCIRPKFKIGQTSYYIFNGVVGIFKPEKVCEVRDILILGIQFYGQEIQYQTTYGLFNENNLFPTKEEAQAKLKELKGENK